MSINPDYQNDPTERSFSDFALKFDKRDFLIAFLIMALAFSYRAVIIFDRAAVPAVSGWFPAATGGDQGVYYASIESFRNGTYPPPTYFFQPGMSWFLIGSSSILGTDNLAVLRLLVAALASINCGLIIAVARLAFQRRSIGVLAGLLLAIYPVGAFYDTDFVITSQAAILITLMLFSVLWLWRRPHNWIGAVLLGISIGIAFIMRFEVAVVGIALSLWLFLVGRERGTYFLLRMGQLLIAAVAAVMVVFPIAYHNITNHADYLITPVGATEIYRGNDRDASGSYEVNRAVETTGFDYYHFLLEDILLSPTRFAQLTLHKIGMYLSDQEPGNNLSYPLSGKAVSSVLSGNPLNYRILVFAYLISVLIALYRRDTAAVPFVIASVVMMGMTLLIWVEARIRTPSIAAMLPLIAYGLVHFFDLLKKGITLSRHNLTRFNPKQFTLLLRSIPRRVWLLSAVLLIVLLAGWVGETTFPLPFTAAALPSDAITSNAIYDNGRLKLLGWKVEDQYTPAGHIEPFRPYVVSLYWQKLAPADIGYYSFSLVYLVDGQKVLSFDHPIGTVAYGGINTANWNLGQIYVEHIGFAYKRYDGPIHKSGSLLLFVYPGRNSEKTYPAVVDNKERPAVELDRPALIWDVGSFTTLTPSGEPISFGDKLNLLAFSMPNQAKPGETIAIRLGWKTTDKQIKRSYSFGIHIHSADGSLAAQNDTPPDDGALLTTSLLTNFRFEDVKQIKMPESSGTYSVYLVVYDSETGDRLAVPDSSKAKDNVLKLGEITVP